MPGMASISRTPRRSTPISPSSSTPWISAPGARAIRGRWSTRCSGAELSRLSACTATEISLLDAHVFAERGAGAAGDDGTGLQHIAAARCLERVACVLLHQQHARARGVDGANGAKDFLDQQRRQAERGFVEAEELGFAHHAAGERQHLLLAARERAGMLRRALGEPRKPGIGPVDEPTDASDIIAIFEAAHFEVLAHAQIREDAAAFGNERDAAPQPFD